MADEPTEAVPEDGELGPLLQLDLPDEPLQTLSITERRLGLRVVPYNVVADSKYGPVLFEPGAFGDINPTDIRLRMDHTDPPTGKGVMAEDRPEAPYIEFGVSKTSRGDDQLTLAVEGVSRGVSPGFHEIVGRTRTEVRDGRRIKVFPRNSAVLREVSTTWQPTFAGDGVMYVLSKDEAKGDGQMAETAEATAVVAPEAPVAQIDTTRMELMFEKFGDRLERLEETRRAEIHIPGRVEAKVPKLYDWASAASRLLIGGKVSTQELQTMALDDVISPDNPGQMPEAFVNDLIGLVRTRRPFLESTERLDAPATGMSITVPVINQHATADVQANEKTDIESTALKVGTETFDGVTIAGGADVAIQLIRRGDPTFFELLIRDLTRAYGKTADSEAIAALLAAGVTPGTGSFDPENLTIGEAWSNSIDAFDEAPNRIWLSADGVAAFIDAKNTGTNAPLYFDLRGNFGAGTGASGDVSALQPVFVPALSGTGVDVLIGPSAGFAWAEDGTWQLQVDVPSKAGRDIALVGVLFPIPRYAAAFTSYSL